LHCHEQSNGFIGGRHRPPSVVACGGGGGSGISGGASQMGQHMTSGFTDSALESNKAFVIATPAAIDADLSNPSGLATSPGFPFRIADNNSNLTTLYSGTGRIQTSEVAGSNATGNSIPASAARVTANSTRQFYNGDGGFLIRASSGQESASFIFAFAGRSHRLPQKPHSMLE
jgi:hypothetical protein